MIRQIFTIDEGVRVFPRRLALPVSKPLISNVFIESIRNQFQLIAARVDQNVISTFGKHPKMIKPVDSESALGCIFDLHRAPRNPMMPVRPKVSLGRSASVLDYHIPLDIEVRRVGFVDLRAGV